jgi:glycine/D-amino acid oxidase-like deaminating enzyme
VKENGSVDYIIVGQGLAGSAAALQLLKLGKRILVVDAFSKNTSSRVAAGLFNPITGRKSVKTWSADKLFPYLHHFYKEAEQVTGQQFFFPIPVYRPFGSVQEQNEWMGKSADEAYENYVESVRTTSLHEGAIMDPFGGLLLRNCGYLNAIAYLKSVREYISSKAVLLAEYFDQEQVEFSGDRVAYKGWNAHRIIFCEGESVLANKWFKNIPIRPLKGETLLIKTDWTKQVILNRGVYMVQASLPGEFKVGATYSFNDNSPGTTDKGRVELEEKLKELIRFPYEIIGQDWGVRPTTPDRRPILGAHPENDCLIIFNGLGTKGVSLAPYFSEVLIRWLENKGTLNEEVSVTRYK